MIRFAVIGTNWITDSFIQAARETGQVELTAVYSRTEARAKEFAAKHDIPNLYTDLEKMVASDEFDAVYIASPTSFHAEQAILCMNHRKHVLCEKPIASHANETKKMIETAAKNNVLLMEALKSTLLPNFRAIQDNLHKIGPIRRYFASYCQYSSRYDAFKQGTVLNAFNPVFSNGSLMDLGVYCIYPMVVLFGMPELIKANAIMLDSGVDGEGSLLLKYKEMDAVIMYSKITNSHLSTEIQGENGTIVIDKINEPGKVEIRYRDGSLDDITQVQTGNTMKYEVQEFVRLLTDVKLESAVNSHAHSLSVMKITDEARRQIGLVFPADSLLSL
ncbi:Gfo/Idh/MocA family protein [Paenibacillus sp. J2TS4]|uniref:Gfo/Idh/MocA family protein n=1 Tax=Paenibacillus sp. J2TS4 TaxID=2807194 RepID=UPI001B122196|nr:Gfo/Idh/MocA family oxidoreductase [Paenibacillus sp. J2TS4]GIP33320.1 putative oxidoreductase YulF [Paenibacillus sp. J2TS4]